MSKKNLSQNILEVIKKTDNTVIGITGSPSTTLDIEIDIVEDSKTQRVLGQMVYVVLDEDGRKVLVIGQIISIKTHNRWHEDHSFKGVIKRHGSLPHLSDNADNRIATISVQACYDLGRDDPEGHILGTSPSTGKQVHKMDNNVMNALMEKFKNSITYIGKVYGTQVDLPMWYKHFGETSGAELGARDAYHIGVFGKTGSGKTVTASYILLGYAKNKESMNILVVDPQGQFYNDKELLPKGSLNDEVDKLGMNYQKYKILDDLFLPKDAYQLFGSLLQKSGFIKKTFNILSDREENVGEAISIYLQNYNKKSKGRSANLNKLIKNEDSLDLMKKTLTKFTETKEVEVRGKIKIEYNKYIDIVYSQNARKDQLIDKINSVLSNKTQINEIYNKYWKPVVSLFTETKEDGSSKKSIDSIIDVITNKSEKGKFIILDLSGSCNRMINENLQAMFVKIIENKIKLKGEEYYEKGEKVNCLIVMDEAHRFISKDSSDPQIAELTEEIIDSVRTTRKYGIGYMFITQTIESLDKQILEQIRIFSFGYGLTSGPELRKISDIINNETAIKLYRSFIDPASNQRFPFMFFGPISPLSFTGSPLFLETYNDVKYFK